MINRWINLLHRCSPVLLGLYWLALAVSTHWPKLDLGPNDLVQGLIQVDKVFHVVGFGGLMALLLWWLQGRAKSRDGGSGPSPRLRIGLVAVTVAGVYALVDEYTQQWFNRQVSWSDVTASLIGVLSVLVLWATPARAAVTARRGWRIILARVTWGLVAPVLALLATVPEGNPLAVRLLRLITVPQEGVDKWLHFWLAMGLTWLLAAGAPAGRRRPRLGAAVTIVLMGVSAPIIEIVQGYTGRGFEVADVYAHQLGLLAALAGWGAVRLWRVGWKQARQEVDGGRSRGEQALGKHDAGRWTPAEADSSRGFVGHAVVVGALTLVSRITGLLRDAVLAAVFGLGPVSDAFFIGFLVPNLFRRLFGEGALSAAFIPHYTELLERDRALAQRFASLCLTLLAVVLCSITILGELALWGMLQLPHDWSQETVLAIRLTMIMLPYMPLICLVALIGGVLQVHRRFGPPAAVPVVLNVVMIAAAAWAAWNLRDEAALSAAAVTVALSVVLAGVLQLLWQTLAMWRYVPLTWSFAGTGATLRSMLVMLLPMLVGLAVFQINAFLDTLIAFTFSAPTEGPGTFTAMGRTIAYPMESGAVAALQWAQRLYQFPLGVFGIAIATAIFPALAAAAPAREGEGDPDPAFARILRQGLRLTVFIGLPASVGIMLLCTPLARVVYERGAFSPEDTERVAVILAGYAASVWAYSMTHVLTRAFYALKDSKTPLRISLIMVAFNLALNVVLIWPLGAAGLAWSTAISAMGQTGLLLLAIRRRVPSPVNAYVLRGWRRTATLTAVMAAAIVPFVLMIDVGTLSMGQTAALLAAMVLLGMAIIFGGAWLSGAEELAWLKRRRGAQTPPDGGAQ